MKLTNLELCKKIAEIEGYSNKIGTQPLNNAVFYCALMFKYGVVIDYFKKHVFIQYKNNITSFASEFESENGIPRAILECIVESKV